jgi:hypothetical protein
MENININFCEYFYIYGIVLLLILFIKQLYDIMIVFINDIISDSILIFIIDIHMENIL